MSKHIAFIAAIVTLVIATSSNEAQAQDSTKTFVPIVGYTADLVVNTHGGIKTGALYLGYAEAGVEINPWKNGRFNFAIGSTHSGEPSSELVGDWQCMDNIEGGNYIFALNAWYSHDIGKVTVKAGLQDVNDSYSLFEASSNLINTSFGLNAVLSSGGHTPTMPNNGLGLNVEYRASSSINWQAGIFDGGFIPLWDDNKFNLKHKLSRSKGYVIITEGAITPNDTWVFKAGAFYHTGLENNGYYGSCEATFPIQGERRVSAFATAGYAPRATDCAEASITCGAKLTSLFSKSGADALSAGMAAVHIDGDKWETALELNYCYQMSDHFYLSPDLQWIINPAGYWTVPNALACILRIGFEL